MAQARGHLLEEGLGNFLLERRGSSIAVDEGHLLEEGRGLVAFHHRR